eukprot:TRINITY_DN36709_c0_g1_i1.p1 TRINITY_DN36709_c0_g1~~TRINITY_DN36709_c0_g1_i1.p1  ORF type:complete len:527 (-),score=140.00 TRINITY_DN36709_c0_g1_i1:262-1842(-)
MIIKCRMTNGKDFDVEVEEDFTIETVKVLVAEELGDDNPAGIKILFKGKVLSDNDASVSSCGIQDKDFVALMVKPKPAPAAPAAPAATPAAAPAPAAGGYAAPAAPAAPGQPAVAAPGTALGPPPEAAVAEMCSMGFPRDDVLKALRAAFNNPDRAMGFLLEGNIPALPEDVAPAPSPAAAAPQQGAAPGGMAWPLSHFGPQLVGQGGVNEATDKALGDASVVLVYFSAHWCPPCRQFTPMLVNAYRQLGEQKQVRVVFASRDRDPGSFAQYFSTMPWHALPFGAMQVDFLAQMFQVRGIPAVVALNGQTGQVLDMNARDAIARSNFNLAACCMGWGVAAPQAAPVVPAAPAAPAEPPKPARKPEPPAVEIDSDAATAALDRVCALEWEVMEPFLVTMLKVLDNPLQNPSEEKFRSLKKTNAALQGKLFNHGEGAAVKLLTLAGFVDNVETIGLAGPPDGRCTAVRDIVQKRGEHEKMSQLRKERDKKIAEEVEKDKSRRPERTMGGDGSGRNTYGGGRKPAGGGG